MNSDETRITRRAFVAIVAAGPAMTTLVTRSRPVPTVEGNSVGAAPLHLVGRTAATTYPTRLEAFLQIFGIRPARLARECGYSRQHLLRIRLGRMEPTRRCMAAIVAALRRMTGLHVRVHHVFEVE